MVSAVARPPSQQAQEHEHEREQSYTPHCWVEKDEREKERALQSRSVAGFIGKDLAQDPLPKGPIPLMVVASLVRQRTSYAVLIMPVFDEENDGSICSVL